MTDGLLAIRERCLGPTYEGTRVEVYSFGRWYPGEVIKLRRTTALVRYTTGTGTTREKAFPGEKVRLVAP